MGNEKLSLPVSLFIDTNQYISNGYYFDKGVFSYISDYYRQGLLELYTHNVVIQEVESHIIADSESIASAYRKAYKESSRQLSALRDASDFGFFFSFPKSTGISNYIKERFQDYMKDNSYAVIDTYANADQLLESYFSAHPPFGPDKKKYEFPDAIIIQSLVKYCVDNEMNFIIISDDSDFEKALSAHPHFTVYKDIKSFLNDLNSTIDTVKTSLIREKWDSDIDRVYEYINEFLHDSSNLEFDEPEVDDLETTDLEIKDIDLESIDSIHGDVAEISLTVHAKIRVSYSTLNEGESAYDPEDDVYVYVVYDNFTENHDITFSVEITVNLDIVEYTLDMSDVNMSSRTVELDDDTRLDKRNTDAITQCPDCGCDITHKNNAGDGFCIRCSMNH